MTEFSILDSWEASGTTLESFKECVALIDKATQVMEVDLKTLRLVSIPPHTDEKTTLPDKMPLHILTEKCVSEHIPATVKYLDTRAFMAKGYPEALFMEAQNRTNLMLWPKDGNICFVSQLLARDLGARIGLIGDAIYQPNEHRDRYFMAEFAKLVKSKAKLIVRKGNHACKVFAMPSENYCYLGQKILSFMLDELENSFGTIECKGWTANHRLTRIWVAFPEMQKDMAAFYEKNEDFMPGMMLETSDTGDCSIQTTAVWYTKTSRLFAEEYSRKHIGNFTVDAFMENAAKKIYDTYKNLPERLCELMSIDVANPRYVLEHLMKDKMMKSLGKRRISALTTALCDSINDEEKYTAYDIAMMFLDGLESRCVFTDGLVREFFWKDLYKIPFADFEKLAGIDEVSAIIAP